LPPELDGRTLLVDAVVAVTTFHNIVAAPASG
jgi:hypothetical protein